MGPAHEGVEDQTAERAEVVMAQLMRFQRRTLSLSFYILPKNLASFYRVLRTWVRLNAK